MDKFLVCLVTFWDGITGKGQKEKGATMVEYGIMVAVIAVIVMVGAGLLGTEIDLLFKDIVSKI